MEAMSKKSTETEQKMSARLKLGTHGAGRAADQIRGSDGTAPCQLNRHKVSIEFPSNLLKTNDPCHRQSTHFFEGLAKLPSGSLMRKASARDLRGTDAA
jgi:hypothetical protein